MRRVIEIGTKARESLTKGADFLAEAVGSTLGPFGQNFFLDKKNTITNDGVKIAGEIQLSPGHVFADGTVATEVHNRGCTALREAAVKTNDKAGDGTTTAVVLAQAIYHACSRFLAREGVLGKKTPSEIIKQIERERKEITAKLAEIATPIESEEQLIKSAIVSVEDKELGELIGKTQWDIGVNGYLLTELTNELFSTVDKVKGVRIDNGFGTSQIINNMEKGILEVSDVPILLTSFTMKGFSEWQKIMPIIESVGKSGQTELVIIARAWTDETVNYCLQNINKGSLKIYPLSAPYMNMSERMKDLAAVTGAVYYDSEGYAMDDMIISGVGRAKKVVARHMEAWITGTDKNVELVDKRVDELKKQLQGTKSDFEKKNLKERLAQLENGFGIVGVGASSEMERQRLFDKAEDAVNAVRAALEEGTVKGGGLAFKEIAESLPDDYLLKRPLMAPYQQLMSLAPTDFVIEDWVRDPVKVLRIALENACSAATAFATAGGVVTAEIAKPLDEMFRLRQGE